MDDAVLLIGVRLEFMPQAITGFRETRNINSSLTSRVASGSSPVEKLVLFSHNTDDFVFSHGQGSYYGNPLVFKGFSFLNRATSHPKAATRHHSTSSLFRCAMVLNGGTVTIKL